MGLNGSPDSDSRPPGDPHRARADLVALAERIAALERGPAAAAAATPLKLGAAAIDAALGGGLPTACVHEIAAPPGPPEPDGAAAGFAAWLAGRFAARGLCVRCCWQCR